MSSSFRPPPGAQTRGFTQPVFISRYSYRGRRVRSISRLLAALAAAWTIAVVVGSMAFLLTRDTRASFVSLPAHRVDCPGTFAGGPWRLSRGHGARATGSQWSISVYSEQSIRAPQIAGDCRAAAAQLPALTAARSRYTPAGFRCKRQSGDRLIVLQSACAGGPAGRRDGFSWYPAVAGA